MGRQFSKPCNRYKIAKKTPKLKNQMNQKECPSYPVKGLISGDPIPTAPVSGCGELSATETSISQVGVPGLTNRRTTGAADGRGGKPNPLIRKDSGPTSKPIGGGSAKGGLVHHGSSKPSTSKAAKVLIGSTPVKNPASGATQGKMSKPLRPVVSQVPVVRSEQTEITPCSQSVPPPAQSAKNANPRHKNPSRKAFLNRRSAYRTVDRLGIKPVEELSEQEKSSLQWARALIEEYQRSRPQPSAGLDQVKPVTKAAPKRQRSEEEQQQSRTKRPKHKPTRLFNMPFNEVVKNRLILAVVDRSVGDGAISHSNWEMVKVKLLEVFWKVVESDPGPPPQCDDAGWLHGHIKLIACADERSANLYKRSVASLGEIWHGARLEAVPPSEVPRRPRSTAKIPAAPSDPMEILRLLQYSNPQLPTHDWKVVKVSEPEGHSRRAIIVLNEQSLAPLRERKGKVYYGFGTIFLSIYRGDDKTDRPPCDGLSRAPQETDGMSCDEAANSSDSESSLSVCGLVGEFFEQMDEAVDEDALLGSDPEDADITIKNNRQDDEGDADKPSPL